jgi:uncharacterized repeat protein (TIGR02543 family)
MKRKNVALVMLAVTVLAGTMTGCQKTQTESAQQTTEAVESTQAQSASRDTYTVTFYDADGTTVLNTTEVVAGENLEEYVPEKEGYTFVGWYATPQMSHKFDFSQQISADTDLFAGFVSYVEDTRTFAVVGSGTSPVLLESNWGAVIGEAQSMTKEAVDGANVYTITLDLEEGDEFQFAIDSSWHDQRGYGYLDTISLDGTDYFQNSGSLGEASTKRSNMKCAVAGNYTFTLTTYPGEDEYETDNANYSEDNKEAFNINPYDVITWTYNGASESAGEEKQVDYYIKGAEITGWEDVYSDETKFTKTDELYTLTVDLTEGDEFMFTSMVTVGDQSSVGTEYIRYTNIAEDDTESLSYVTGTDSANLVAAKAGTYTFTYDPQTQVLTVSCK